MTERNGQPSNEDGPRGSATNIASVCPGGRVANSARASTL
jgi:hypothetical protein